MDAGTASGDAKNEQKSSTETNSDSSASNLDFSSEDGSSDVSDLDKLEEAYNEFGRLTEGANVLDYDRNVALDLQDTQTIKNQIISTDTKIQTGPPGDARLRSI